MSNPVFKGFAAQSRLVRIPEVFFQEILPELDDMDEMRVTLYSLWYLERLEQPVKYLHVSDYMRDKALMRSFGGDPETHLMAGLHKAITRGTLLCYGNHSSLHKNDLILANTPRSQAAMAALHSGKVTIDQLASHPVQMDIIRPNIFELYEQNIAALTPMMAEILKDAEINYPAAWIEEAIELAVQNNSRRWKYVEAILRKWKENGRDGSY